MIEVEKRGFLTKEKYEWLLNFLNENGENLGQDNKNVIYYIYDDKLLKVVHNESKRNAKISLKTNKIGRGSAFPEIEVFFEEKDFEKMKYILDKIVNPKKIMSGIQERMNFMYKGAEIAVKWSNEWKFHFEIEKVVADNENTEKIEKELYKLANELDIKIMTDEELTKFTEKMEKNEESKS